jgi:hypothetical protein
MQIGTSVRTELLYAMLGANITSKSAMESYAYGTTWWPPWLLFGVTDEQQSRPSLPVLVGNATLVVSEHVYAQRPPPKAAHPVHMLQFCGQQVDVGLQGLHGYSLPVRWCSTGRYTVLQCQPGTEYCTFGFGFGLCSAPV